MAGRRINTMDLHELLRHLKKQSKDLPVSRALGIDRRRDREDLLAREVRRQQRKRKARLVVRDAGAQAVMS